MKLPAHYYMVDNLRLIAIFLVVLGHMCETVNFFGSNFLYIWIYSFHMPLFVCISGFCFNYGSGEKFKIFKKFIYPYIIFQIFWLLFNTFAMHSESEITLSVPVWTMWYLMSMVFWYIAAHLLEINNASPKWVLLISTAIALLIGYDKAYGYYLSLSRTIVLFPFFYFGIYLKQNFYQVIKFRSNTTFVLSAISLVFIATIFLYVFRLYINSLWLYHSYPYESSGSNILYRSISFIIALIFIFALICIVPEKKFGWVTELGQNTLSIYLLHGYAVKILGYIGWSNYVQAKFLWCIVISFAMLLLFGSKTIVTLLHPLMRWPFPSPSSSQNNYP